MGHWAPPPSPVWTTYTPTPTHTHTPAPAAKSNPYTSPALCALCFVTQLADKINNAVEAAGPPKRQLPIMVQVNTRCVWVGGGGPVGLEVEVLVLVGYVHHHTSLLSGAPDHTHTCPPMAWCS